jgi:hypothetical protein
MEISMPTAANIVINDAVPAARTFAPVTVSPGRSALYEKTVSLTSGGMASIVLDFSLASPKRKTDRVAVRLNLPKEVTDVNGVTTVASTARFEGVWVIPENFTTAERGDFEALVDNLIGHATVEAYVKSRDPFYG